jgi:hypothetical protein
MAPNRSDQKQSGTGSGDKPIAKRRVLLPYRAVMCTVAETRRPAVRGYRIDHAQHPVSVGIQSVEKGSGFVFHVNVGTSFLERALIDRQSSLSRGLESHPQIGALPVFDDQIDAHLHNGLRQTAHPEGPGQLPLQHTVSSGNAYSLGIGNTRVSHDVIRLGHCLIYRSRRIHGRFDEVPALRRRGVHADQTFAVPLQLRARNRNARDGWFSLAVLEPHGASTVARACFDFLISGDIVLQRGEFRQQRCVEPAGVVQTVFEQIALGIPSARISGDLLRRVRGKPRCPILEHRREFTRPQTLRIAEISDGIEVELRGRGARVIPPRRSISSKHEHAHPS